MTILVSAASGHLGTLVVEALLARGVAPADLVAGARTPSKLADLAARGIRTVELDYSVSESLTTALAEVDTLLFISSSEPGNRVEGHKNVIAAAKTAGIKRLVYTSTLGATVDWALAPDHKATEEALAASGIPSTVLRDGWYTENLTPDVLRAADSGVIASSVGDARISSASRKDFAEAAAVVLTDDGHLGKTYELAGDVAWNYDDLAAAASELLGRDVTYVRLSPAEFGAALQEAGLGEGMAGFVVAMEAGIATGVLEESSGTLSRLIGHPTTPLIDGLRADIEATRAATH